MRNHVIKWTNMEKKSLQVHCCYGISLHGYHLIHTQMPHCTFRILHSGPYYGLIIIMLGAYYSLIAIGYHGKRNKFPAYSLGCLFTPQYELFFLPPLALSSYYVDQSRATLRGHDHGHSVPSAENIETLHEVKQIEHTMVWSACFTRFSDVQTLGKKS